jgi:hypothetical protein
LVVPLVISPSGRTAPPYSGAARLSKPGRVLVVSGLAVEPSKSWESAPGNSVKATPLAG